MVTMPVHDHYQTLDPRFASLIHKNAFPDMIWTGGKWCEGPAYLPQARYLVWSDIPNDRVMRWDEVTGQVGLFQGPCGHHNGHAVDAQGRLVSCEHGGRAVSRIGHDGSRHVLADRFDGKRLNSPNDVVVRSDGSVWFTDPTYGIDSNYEGHAAPSEIGASNVYRLAPDGAGITCVIEDLVRPNGLAFSPDETILYVSDTGQSHDPDCAPKIRAYDVDASGEAVANGRTLMLSSHGVFDGFRVDSAGNLWSSAGDGVHCFAADGTLLGKILLPEVVSNLTFGGPKANRLFITARSSVYAIYVNAIGITRFG